MRKTISLSALGGAVAIAAVAGLHFGQAAVSEIDPIYYQGPAVHPRDRGAAIAEPWEPQQPKTLFASLYGWAEGQAARAEECSDCTPGHPDYHAYARPAHLARGPDAEDFETGAPAAPAASAVLVHRPGRDTEDRAAVEDSPATLPVDAVAEAPALTEQQRRRKAVDLYASYPVEEPASYPVEEQEVTVIYASSGQ